MTHTKKRRSAFDGYDRGLQWERTCAEISKLKITRRPAGRREMIALPIAAGAEGVEMAETAENEASRYSGRYSLGNPSELPMNYRFTRGSQARRRPRPQKKIRST